jgi:hypothetical protein
VVGKALEEGSSNIILRINHRDLDLFRLTLLAIADAENTIG